MGGDFLATDSCRSYRPRQIAEFSRVVSERPDGVNEIVFSGRQGRRRIDLFPFLCEIWATSPKNKRRLFELIDQAHLTSADRNQLRGMVKVRTTLPKRFPESTYAK